MKSRSLALLISVFIFFVTAASASTKYSGGTGEPNDPYKIATAQDLIDLRNEPNDYSKHFVQDANIDLSGYVFDGALIAWDSNSNKTGFNGKFFNGKFNGQGYIIKNLHIQGQDYLGMFGQIYSDALLLNITLENTDVNGTGNYTGSLIGYNSGGKIRLCSNNGLVRGNNTVGGLVGYNNEGNIRLCFNNGLVIGNNTVGGLTGGNYGNIISSYNTGAVESNTNITGGLTGSNNGKIIFSYNTGAIESKNNTAGGLAGSNYGNITLSYNTGAVESKNNTVGGLAGGNSGGSIISCYNSGGISGYFYVGGVAGSNYEGNIIRSYNIGKISKGTQYVGGLVGANCSTRPGSGCGFVTSSFWDIQASGRSFSDGGIGLTTVQMQDANNYINAGWDFVGEQGNGTCNFWFIGENNYPQLTAFSEDPIYELQGSGTTNDPYLIYDANDLGTIWYRPAAHYSLEADINLSDITWNQAVIPWLEGSFNGNNHIIQSLHIEGNNYLGLFGELYENSEISNLTLESVDINGVGNYIGGLVGYNDNGSITSDYTTGKITGKIFIGGIVGYNDSIKGIKTSFSTVIVSGENYVGGLLGYNYYGIITSSKSSGSVSGNDYIGGLVGHNSGNISSCCSDSTVMGNKYIGGLVGNNGMSILTCYATGTIIGSSYVGGLIGQNNARFESKLSYSTGLVSGINNIGGLVGNVNNYSFNTCFWDTETSGLSISGGGIGKTTAEMQDINTFLDAGWDFIGETDNGTEDIWWIDNGLDYPRLWWELETE